MGIREKINQSKGVGVGISIGLVAVAAALWAWSQFDAASVTLAKAFYSVDDGSSYFADDIKKVAPFDHEGKPAMRAYVFEVDGKPTVAYLERFTAAAKPMAEQLRAQDDGSMKARSEWGEFMLGPVVEVKKPGAAGKWLAANSPEGNEIKLLASGGAPAVYP